MDERTVAITLNGATRASNLDKTAAVAKGTPGAKLLGRQPVMRGTSRLS
jgi:hypothetical protein